jgi:hypothetical protein
MTEHEQLHALRLAANAIFKIKGLTADQKAWLLNQLTR